MDPFECQDMRATNTIEAAKHKTTAWAKPAAAVWSVGDGHDTLEIECKYVLVVRTLTL